MLFDIYGTLFISASGDIGLVRHNSPQLAEIRARVGYRQALAAYYASTGTFLEAKSVEISGDEPSESVHDYWKDVKWLQFTDTRGASGEVTMPAAPVESAEAD